MELMTDKDYDVFYERMAELMEVFQRVGEVEQLAHEIGLYFGTLKTDFTLKDVIDCIEYIKRHDQFYPKIARFYEAFEEVKEIRFEEGRQRAMKYQEEQRRKAQEEWDALPQEEKDRQNKIKKQALDEIDALLKRWSSK